MAETTSNARLEAFCDGVFAIALTLLVIELKPPPIDSIRSLPDFWHALQHRLPAVFALVLSFGIILITWINHHGTLKLVRGSTPSFMYANGFLLLSVVLIPFPTALLGEFIATDYAAPAVVLYNAVLAVQAMGWILLTGTALKNNLTSDQRAAVTMRGNNRNGYLAFALYALLAVAGFWFPLTIAIVTTATWLFWLVLGISLKHA
jgi:uncharacterized membrane protein